MPIETRWRPRGSVLFCQKIPAVFLSLKRWQSHSHTPFCLCAATFPGYHLHTEHFCRNEAYQILARQERAVSAMSRPPLFPGFQITSAAFGRSVSAVSTRPAIRPWASLWRSSIIQIGNNSVDPVIMALYESSLCIRIRMYFAGCASSATATAGQVCRPWAGHHLSETWKPRTGSSVGQQPS